MPITEASEVFCNRLWSPAWLGMGLGYLGLFLMIRGALTNIAKLSFIGLVVGFAMLCLGNFVEYWIFNELPTDSNSPKVVIATP